MRSFPFRSLDALKLTLVGISDQLDRGGTKKTGLLTKSVKFFQDETDRENSLLKNFSILRSELMEGPYEVDMDSIHTSTRGVFVPMEYTLNYFRIEANPKDGKPLSSMPVFIIGIDSIPPAKPLVIEGIIDTNGLVRISWRPNSVPDLWGYRVFKANFGKEEYALLNAKPTMDTVYFDSVSQRLATDNIF